jgi:hypothetical protein
MPRRDERRRPPPVSAPANNLTASQDSRCTCTTYGWCVTCSDRRTEAWKYRRPLIELAKVAEVIAEEQAVAQVEVERRIAHQMVLIWGGSAA